MLITCEELKNKYNIIVTGIIHVGSHLLEEKKDYNTHFEVKDENILWFDANINIVELSKQNYPNSLIYHVAASDKDNLETKLIVMNSTMSSSLLELGLHKKEYPWCHETHRQTVFTKRLDTWLSENIEIIKHIDFNFCNLDIQGYELQVLKGLGVHILNFDYLYLEVNFSEMYIDNAKVNEIDEYLHQFGFNRVETKFASENWGDAFYIRNSHIINNNTQIWCISLQKEIKRKQNIRKFSEEYNLDINFLNAISGLDVNVNEFNGNHIIEHNDIKYYYDNSKRQLKLSYGEIACLLSHLQLFDNLIKSSNSHYIILEDDAKLDLESCELLKNTITSITHSECNDIDLVLLSSCITHYKPTITTRYNANFSNIEFKSFNMMNGYIISKKGAIKVLDYIKSISSSYKYTLSVPIDNVLSDLFLSKKLITVVPVDKNNQDIRMIACDSFESSIWNIVKPNENWNDVVYDKLNYKEYMITMPNLGIHCRLGNQMFQYATMKAIELKTGTKLYLKSEWFTENRCRLKIAFKNNITYKELTNDLQKTITHDYGEKNFKYDPNIWNEVANKSQNVYGYFQSYKYFDEFKDWIVECFTFNTKVQQECKNTIKHIKKLINYTPLIGIHIRLGDLQHSDKDGQIYTISTNKYIQNAINKMNEIMNSQCYYIICSDSQKYCKDTYSFNNNENIIYIETDTSDYQDMCLLSLCDHMIMSASSFSFWAAYLNKNECKKIIYPHPWFNANCERVSQYDTKDLLPNEWIKMNVV